MNDPCAQHQCLVINVTSIKEGRAHDSACELNPGDHPFIVHPSYVLYRMAETLHKARIGRYIDSGYYLSRNDWQPDVFARIAAGIYTSDETILRIVRYAKENGI
ncbi:hypothetical protein BTR14_03155 [Rhizobium rhizosphaerae]|uniref:Uncharacterized protein n=2 Tax=Xaviernesmea rhizosphaerae TaxID=1672749 RepID=A0ABX3PGE0_9HYPH|nr:hypothetical protein BTR14_03155 [Xaviernesmea rhizosphaerae]